MRHLFPCIGLFFVCALALVTPLSAARGTELPLVLISEVAWSGSSRSDADEWIELVNLSEETISLDGWSVSGGAASGASLPLASGSIAPKSTYLIANYPRSYEKTVLDTDPQQVTSAISLANQALHLALIDNLGQTRDEVTAPFAGTSGSIRASMERMSANQDASAWMTATAALNLLDPSLNLGTPGTSPLVAQSQDQNSVNSNTATDANRDTGTITPDAVTPSETTPLLNNTSNTDNSVTSQATPENVAPDGTTPDATTIKPTETTNETIVQSPSANTAADPIAERALSMNEFSVNGDEWIELFNKSGTVIALDGYWLEDATAKKSELHGSIEPTGFFLAANLSIALNNDEDDIRLFAPNGTLLDSVHYGGQSGAATPKKNASTIRMNDTGSSKDDFTITTHPTPGTLNIFTPTAEAASQSGGSASSSSSSSATPTTETGNATATPQNANTNLIPITPFFLTIEGPAETYVEQANLFEAKRTPENTAPCTYAWEIDGKAGGDSEVLRTIFHDAGKRRMVLRAACTNFSATATRDITVGTLGGPHNNSATATATASIAGKNVANAKAATPSSKAKNSASKSAGTKTVVREGTVTAAPGTLGAQYFYIDTDNLQVYLYSKDFPTLVLGDRVRVRGTISDIADGKRLKIKNGSDITVLTHQNPVEPLTLSTSDLGKDHLGDLVAIEGEVRLQTAQRFMLHGDELDIIISKKASAKIENTITQNGDMVRVTGIVQADKDGVRLVPRSSEDITVVKKFEPEVLIKGSQERKGMLSSLGGMLAIAVASMLLTLLGSRMKRKDPAAE